MNDSFAMYRLPHADCCQVIRQQEGRPREFHSYEQLAGLQGFVVAPFSISANCPLVLIEGTRCEVQDTRYKIQGTRCEVRGMRYENTSASCPEDTAWPFRLFHEQLTTGRFRKIVLSRRFETPVPAGFDAEALFFRACALYPRMMIALVNTPQTGLWLTATPEVLLEAAHDHYYTMALAGTQNLGSGLWDEHGVTWDEKNMMEQRYVATYIEQCLKPFADDIDEQGPYTQRAGHLAHLRSDFHFHLRDRQRLGQLLSALHPTPAVCGLPKQDALDFILSHEPYRRRYYSGFLGPLDLSGETHLYVMLRCMEQAGDRLWLYAGGGLLKDSQQQKEWEETEAKLDTMRRLIWL